MGRDTMLGMHYKCNKSSIYAAYDESYRLFKSINQNGIFQKHWTLTAFHRVTILYSYRRDHFYQQR